MRVILCSLLFMFASLYLTGPRICVSLDGWGEVGRWGRGMCVPNGFMIVRWWFGSWLDLGKEGGAVGVMAILKMSVG